MSPHRAATFSGQVAFGPFRLLPAQQLLLEGDKTVRLGSRARDILIALLERPGEILSKQELLGRVWPDTFVEEGNLKVHVAALRRALGDGQAGKRFITNIPGRGYSFVAPVTLSEDETETVPARPVERAADIPPPLARMVGRSDIVSALAAQLTQHRFITILGPGGIGKTTVALAVADSLLDSFRDGVRFVDLAALTDPQLVPSALAAVLGAGIRSDNPLRNLIAFLKEKQLLLVLDSCEHVIEAAATLAEEIFRGTKKTHLLVTSREVLRAEGERVHRLSPLAFPADTVGLKAADALSYPAVQLFVERAAASLGAFELGDAEAPLVADMCRRLDGIALAIEIAASRVDAFGVAGLAKRLDDRFRLLMQGRRTALPRHRTLSATLDWSYAQLGEFESVVLRRLAVFAGTFTMESASAVLSSVDRSAAADVVDTIAELIAKSLVAAGVDGAIAFYRLLDTTRAYALAKLEESGERARLSLLHAQHYLDVLEAAEGAWETRPVTEWLDRHRHLIDNVRAALDWAFSPSGDLATGIALTVAAIPLWFALSLTSECAERIDCALAAPGGEGSAGLAMRLYAARAWSLMQTRGFVAETQAAWARVLELAEQQGSADYELRALWGLWAAQVNRGDFRPALTLAERFHELTARQADAADGLVGDRMFGYTLHMMGEQTRARHYLERMLAGYQLPVIGAQIIRFVFDQRAMARCFLARIFWLQGAADDAMALVKTIVDEAIASDDVLSLCQAIVQGACPVALFVGDLSAVERYVLLLLDHSERQGLHFWQTYGHCFEGVLVIKHGRIGDGLTKLAAALEELREIQYGVFYSFFYGEFACALGAVGKAGDGLQAIDEALARCERNDERWYLPELLRIKGELLFRRGAAGDAGEAERQFLESMAWSRRQQTDAWELRAIMSLAALWQTQNRTAEARALVEASYRRFKQGFATADLRAAERFLSER